jgi:hypothetical protein
MSCRSWREPVADLTIATDHFQLDAIGNLIELAEVIARSPNHSSWPAQTWQIPLI